MKNLIFVSLLLVMCIGCGNLIENKDLQGRWFLQLGGDYDESREFYEINFISENRVEVFDSGRREVLNYELEKDILIIHFKNEGEKIIEFQEIKGDTLVAKDSIFFYAFIDSHLEGENSYRQVEEYELLNVEKDFFTFPEKKINRYIDFHLY